MNYDFVFSINIKRYILSFIYIYFILYNFSNVCDIFFKNPCDISFYSIEILQFDIRNLFIVLILHEYISNYIDYYLCSYFSYFFISQYLTHISKKKKNIFNKFLFSPWIGSKLMSLPIRRLSEMTDEMEAEILQISRIGIFANLVETIILT